MGVYFCFGCLQTTMFAVAGCTYMRLKSTKRSLTRSEVFTDQLGSLGTAVFPTQNPYYSEALQKEENEEVSTIRYSCGEKLLPKGLYRALVDKLTNNCAPADRCMFIELFDMIIVHLEVQVLHES